MDRRARLIVLEKHFNVVVKSMDSGWSKVFFRFKVTESFTDCDLESYTFIFASCSSENEDNSTYLTGL